MPAIDFSPPSRLPSLAILVGIAASVYFVLLRIFQIKFKPSHQSRLPLPPGPKGLPLIGNFFDIPAKERWLKATEWIHEYGEVVHVNAIGQRFIYLNTYEVACDLLELRSAKYSDRVVTAMTKMTGASEKVSEMPYGDKWRTSRRMFHQEFNSNSTVKHLDIQARHGMTMLRHIFQEPTSFEQHIKHFSSGIILEAVYGLQVQDRNDPYVRGAELTQSAGETSVTGAYTVDFFPFLKHLPARLPGLDFKRKAAMYHQYHIDNNRLPYQAAREQMLLDGGSNTSMISRWVEKINAMQEEKERERLEDCLQRASGVALLGGYGTTSSTILILIYLMILHPEIQAKIQAELDAVIGKSRLPDFSDRENLPYVNAVYKELIRWHPLAPLGAPHRAIMEDEYKGMRIPEGSIMIPNVWAMVRDKDRYGPDADIFRPDRFIESDLWDPTRLVFGFGRRICPGRYLAENSLFLAITSIMHLFKIGKAVDENGVEVPPVARWSRGLSVHLEPFSCCITPRFEGVEELLRSCEDGL